MAQNNSVLVFFFQQAPFIPAYSSLYVSLTRFGAAMSVDGGRFRLSVKNLLTLFSPQLENGKPILS